MARLCRDGAESHLANNYKFLVLCVAALLLPWHFHVTSVIILGSSSAKPKINAIWGKFPNAAHAPGDKDVLAFVLGDCWLTCLAHLQSGQVEPRTLSPRLSRRHHRRYQQLSIAAKTLRAHPRSTAVAATPTGHFALRGNVPNLKHEYIPNMNYNLEMDLKMELDWKWKRHFIQDASKSLRISLPNYFSKCTILIPCASIILIRFSDALVQRCCRVAIAFIPRILLYFCIYNAIHRSFFILAQSGFLLDSLYSFLFILSLFFLLPPALLGFFGSFILHA